MRSRRLWIAAAVGCGALGLLFWATHFVTITGVVLKESDDPRQRTPIRDVSVTVANTSSAHTKSDALGFFRIVLRRSDMLRGTLTLTFRHPGYGPLDLQEIRGEQLHVVRLKPLQMTDFSRSPFEVVNNLRVRYSTSTMTRINVGSLSKVFQVQHVANEPCNHAALCSPDGRWNAAEESETIDAGEQNELQDVRVVCIAGPCPFTKIEHESTSRDQVFRVTVRNWSESATFLLSAEVVRSVPGNISSQSFPVIFGRDFDFSLPSAADGVSLQAEINGEMIIFPLGPTLLLSWATCETKTLPEQPTFYHCELKSGYRFAH